ncbi:MAG: hypothetical protein GC131_06995 [Alphaproteobacteria bacterium]|nr:hypothetical protein [Alphaproteobacteria bacterium]
MADGSTSSGTNSPGAPEGGAADQRLAALVATIRNVGAPLLGAVTEVAGVAAKEAAKNNLPHDKAKDAEVLAALIDSTVDVAHAMVDGGLGEKIDQEWVRWAVAASASQMVAAHYRATGRAMTPDEAMPLLQHVAGLAEKFKSLAPRDQEPVANSIATFHAKTIEALVPVVNAVAQYSFGRAEHSLVADVAERLVKTADQITRSLAPAGASPGEWRILCWSVLRAAGQVYADSHYAEADRLLYMDEAARAEYFAKNEQKPPLGPVWQNFNQRMGMLATLAAYLEVPASARLDAQGWQ